MWLCTGLHEFGGNLIICSICVSVSIYVSISVCVCDCTVTILWSDRISFSICHFPYSCVTVWIYVFQFTVLVPTKMYMASI